MVQLLTIRDAARQVGGRMLWRGVSFEVASGDRLVVDGPSGSGKTLLLRALAWLDPLSSGLCEFRGKAPEFWSVPAYRSRVMYVPQRAALPGGTVLEVLSAPFRLSVHKARVFDQAAVTDLLESLGRPADLLQAQTATLSGGEVQSVQLARALLLDPTVLLLDEVTSALDPALAAKAEQAILNWCGGHERALVWVGHDTASQERMGTTRWQIQPAEIEQR